MDEDDYDDGNYDFQYETDDEPPDEEADIENQYYSAKGSMEEGEEVTAEFEKVLKMEEEKGKWGFKALKQMCKLLFLQGKEEEMLQRYTALMTYVTGNAVTRNVSEKGINKLLDLVSSSSKLTFLEEFYEKTLAVLGDTKNERLWFNTTVKLCRICFEARDYAKMQRILKTLHAACRNPEGVEDAKRGTQLQEVYALEIQLCTELQNHKKLKELYTASMRIKSAIPHPRIMGVIRECGGKMYMSEHEWVTARTDFFEAFKNFDEAGHPRRIACLKYLVLANMLSMSRINPFDSPECKPYSDNSEIVAMTNLLTAYEERNITEFEDILRTHRASVMEDPFIRLYIEDLLCTIRTRVLLALVKPYTRITIQHIASSLNITAEEVEGLVVTLILDGQMEGHIDQMEQVVVLNRQDHREARYRALGSWAKTLNNVYSGVLTKLTTVEGLR